MMPRYATAALLALGAASLAGRAFADDTQHVTVQATTSATYASNVAASDAAGAAARGVSPQDEILQPGIGLDISVPFEGQNVFIKGTAGYEIYARNSQLDSQSIDLQGGISSQFRTCKATLSGQFADAQTKLQDLTLAVTRNIEDSETVRIDSGCGAPIGFGPTFSVLEQWSNNSAPQLITSDFRQTTVSAGLAYRRPGLGELSVFGSYSQNDFPNRDLLVGPATTQDGYREYSVGVRLDHRVSARIEGTVSIAYTTLVPYVAGVQGYGGLDLKADFSARLSPRLQAHITAERAPLPTIVSNATYSLETTLAVEAEYAVDPRLSFKIGGTTTTDNYNGGALIPGVDIQRETIWSVTGTGHLQISHRLSVDLTYTHEARSADIGVYNYDDDRVGLSLSAAI